MIEATFTHHIAFTVSGMSTIGFKPHLSHDVPSFYWSENGGQSWSFYNSTLPWVILEAGEYIISFPETHFTPEFGAGLSEFAEKFQRVEFLPDYIPTVTNFSNMFENCTHLIDLDLGNLALGVDTGSVRDANDMFGSRTWNADTMDKEESTITMPSEIREAAAGITGDIDDIPE